MRRRRELTRDEIRAAARKAVNETWLKHMTPFLMVIRKLVQQRDDARTALKRACASLARARRGK